MYNFRTDLALERKDIYQKAKELLQQMYQTPKPIRLVGVRIDNLIEKEEKQLSLFQNEN